MNIYEINTHDFRNGSGSQTIAARNAGEALRLFAQSKDGEALLEETQGVEIRLFKSSSGVVLSSAFDNPNGQRCEECVAVPVPPPESMPLPSEPPAVKPVDIFGSVILPALLAVFAASGAPKRKTKAKRKK